MIKLDNENIVVGSANISTKPLKPFDSNVLNFLDLISKEIQNNNKTKFNSEISTFGFFCRKKNLQKLKKIHFIEKNGTIRLGLGLAFHITPSNIPTNFAYSLVFGLLCGNSNIIKLPSQNFYEIEQLCFIFNKVLKKFPKIKKLILIVKTENSEGFSKKISEISDLRVIWGGNETINKLKDIKTSERCRDLHFPNRNSFCVLNLNEISKKNNKEIIKICNEFYNDTFLVDQNACSSPHLIYWVGKKNKKTIDIFWKSLEKVVAEKKYTSFFSGSYYKYNKLCNEIINFDNFDNFDNYKNFYCINLKRNIFNINDLISKLGYFYQIQVNNINEVFKNVDSFTQTMTYYGFEKDVIKKNYEKNCLKGIDRIVPIGQALSIEFNWDGYELFNSMTRTISLR